MVVARDTNKHQVDHVMVRLMKNFIPVNSKLLLAHAPVKRIANSYRIKLFDKNIADSTEQEETCYIHSCIVLQL